MIKPTPNPPEDPATSPYESLDSKKLHEAAERALDHHLGTPPPKIHLADARKGQLFIVAPDAPRPLWCVTQSVTGCIPTRERGNDHQRFGSDHLKHLPTTQVNSGC
jgi:hypothetical protein